MGRELNRVLLDRWRRHTDRGTVPEPTGYDKAHEKPCSRGDCVIGVGWDVYRGSIIRFLVDLQYTESLLSPSYTQIARFDHNPTTANGHDIYSEGIHIDVAQKDGQDIKFTPPTFARSYRSRNCDTSLR